MAPGALVCVAGEGRARCPASCCSAARLPCRFIFRSAAIGPRGLARHGRAGWGQTAFQRGGMPGSQEIACPRRVPQEGKAGYSVGRAGGRAPAGAACTLRNPGPVLQPGP